MGNIQCFILNQLFVFAVIVGLAFSAGCPEANFPIQIGGPTERTVIRAIDYHETTKILAVGGFTRCYELKKDNDGTSGALPLIMSYVPDSNGVIGDPDWGYTLALQEFVFV